MVHAHHIHTATPPPVLTPWWFYTSPLPLDDPLSPLPVTTSNSSTTKHPPRPFSHRDTRALEKAYQGLLVNDGPPTDSRPQTSSGRTPSTSVPAYNVSFYSHHHVLTEQQEYAEEGRGSDVLNAPIRPRGDPSATTTATATTPTGEKPGMGGLIIRGRTLGRSTTNLIRPGELLAKQLRNQDERSPPPTAMDNRRRRRRSSSPEVNPWTGNPIYTRTSDYSTAGSSPSTSSAGAAIHPPPSITTNPFIRSLSKTRNRSRSSSPAGLVSIRERSGAGGISTKRHKSSSMSSISSFGVDSFEREPPSPTIPPNLPVKQKEIPVGVQRLHKVLLPSLTMAPIYWSPLNGISGVCRGTWFYRDTMLPVETDMANRLERGYCEVRAWTEEWDAELESAVQVGREGEEKVRWRLWDISPSGTPATVYSRPGTSSGRTEPMDIGGSLGRRFDGTFGSKPPTPRRGFMPSYGSSWASSPGSKMGTPPTMSSGVSAAMLPPSQVMSSMPSSSMQQILTTAAASDMASEYGGSQSTPPTPTTSTGMSAAAVPNPNDWVIFANAKEAYICRDTMLGFGNRRPLVTIRNAAHNGNSSGVNVGIRVVRGFDVGEWERLHPKRKITGSASKKQTGVGTGAAVSVSAENKRSLEKGDAVTEAIKDVESLQGGEHDDDRQDRQEVSDLILVIHGIGQKLSERVESFHFTHAINSFRRLMNTELRDPAVTPCLRDPKKAMMVLPINWRFGLSFEDSGSAASKKRTSYGLEDITLSTIPAVRNLIGDVMLDIPYYLSHNHKHKMIDAVVREANRVYGLWKTYNPGWEERGGRVHLIAHSLGSAIALDVLSKQPTRIADWRRERELAARARGYTTAVPPVDVGGATSKGCYGCSGRGRREASREREHVQTEIEAEADEQHFFDFDTSALICAGSPAGFFLLLNRAMLLPRRGRRKEGCSPGADEDPNIVGERGTYGCLSVDNIYNVMNYSDPIAYRLNPTVDTEYAENIKIQPIPSATSTLFGSIGSTLRSVLPGGGGINSSAAAANSSAAGLREVVPSSASAPPSYSCSDSRDMISSPSPPPSKLPRLPSNIELETHDFSREEVAEKRMVLLNENGTMDWYVGSSGGWVLENQYVNMLGAHSSYWESRDFARFVVAEAGRWPGKRGVREGVRAVKVRAGRSG